MDRDLRFESEEDKIGYDVIGAAFTVRNHTGRGLLEKFYENALAIELEEMGYEVESQVAIPALYKGRVIQDAYRADLIVEKKVILEIKALTLIDNVESCQLNTYLKLSGYKLGFLINFGAREFTVGNLHEEPPYEKGIYRMANKFKIT